LGQALLEERHRFTRPRGAGGAELAAAAQVEVDGLGRGAEAVRGRVELHSQRVGDALAHDLLQLEDVLEAAIETIAPELDAVVDVDEPRAHSDALAARLHAARDDGLGAEALADGSGVGLVAM